MSKPIPSLLPLRACLFGLALGAGYPAIAAPALTSTLATYPLAPLAEFNIACQAPAPVSSIGSLVSPSSKKAAILGGEMSALERIKMQQAATAASAVETVAVAGPAQRLEPAANGPRIGQRDCHDQAQNFAAVTRTAPIAGRSSSDFLGSSRVRIGKTNFDREWKRVDNETVSAKVRFAADGSPARSLATVKKINRWVNREIRYVEDRDLFGRADYWAGARLTMALRSGDCEDIALTKMQLLASMGFKRDDMFLTIARDNVRRADHALLVVRVDGRFVVLDNTTDKILDGAYSHDYTPVLSFSTGGKWLHGYKTASAR